MKKKIELFGFELSIEKIDSQNQKSYKKEVKSENGYRILLWVGISLFIFSFLSEYLVNLLINLTNKLTNGDLIYLIVALLSIVVLAIGNILYNRQNKVNKRLYRWVRPWNLLLIIITIGLFISIAFFEPVFGSFLTETNRDLILLLVSFVLTLYIVGVFHLVSFTIAVLLKEIFNRVNKDLNQDKESQYSTYIAALAAIIAFVALFK